MRAGLTCAVNLPSAVLKQYTYRSRSLNPPSALGNLASASASFDFSAATAFSSIALASDAVPVWADAKFTFHSSGTDTSADRIAAFLIALFASSVLISRHGAVICMQSGCVSDTTTLKALHGSILNGLDSAQQCFRSHPASCTLVRSSAWITCGRRRTWCACKGTGKRQE